MVETAQPALFEPADLDDQTWAFVRERTNCIHQLIRRTAADIVEIGRMLTEVKARLPHGDYLGWLEREFRWNQQSAWRFMAVYDQFKSLNLSDLKVAPSALYLLASPSTTDEARADAIERAELGESITYLKAQEIVADHKAASAPFRPSAQQRLDDGDHETDKDLAARLGPAINGSDPYPLDDRSLGIANLSPDPTIAQRLDDLVNADGGGRETVRLIRQFSEHQHQALKWTALDPVSVGRLLSGTDREFARMAFRQLREWMDHVEQAFDGLTVLQGGKA